MPIFTDYRNLLKEELNIRRKRSSAYSIRAFSRDLGLTPSHLVQLFSLKKNLSEAKVTDVLDRLTWSEERKQYFWLSFKRQSARTAVVRMRYDGELAKFYKQITP